MEEHSAHDTEHTHQGGGITTMTGASHPPSHEQHVGSRHEGHSVADFRRRFWVSLALTIPVVLISPGLPVVAGGRVLDVPAADWILLALSTLLYVYGGLPFLKGLVRELRGRKPGMMTLVAVAISVAYFYSTATVLGLEGMPFFWELATLIDVMLLGHWIEMRSVGEASKALESLARLMPSQAHRLDDGGAITDVDLAELEPGDTVLVRPGEKVPADGEVTQGASSANESMLTGESVPVAKGPGDGVIGGSINGEGSLTVIVRRTGAESFLAQVIELVREAQASQSKTQDLADRAAMWLTLVALTGGALTFAVWIALGETSSWAMERAVTVMVTACPHALGLAIPLVVAVSTALAAREGLLVRDRMAFENARAIDTVIFDKTGTLTLGSFGIDEIIVFGHADGDEVLTLAASIERLSEHPIAQAIAASVDEYRDVQEFMAVPGKGARGRIDDHDVAVVSPGYLAEAGLPEPPGLREAEADGRTLAVVLRDDEAIGAIALSDVVRPESAEAVERLQTMGIAAVMLTGDNDAVAKRVAARLGIGRFFAEVLPADKATTVRRIQAERGIVAMVGDGVNDAPSLATADVGIAIGAGTDVAVATADIVLVRSDPRDIATVVGLARATYRKMIQNLVWATGYNVIALPLAAGVLASYGVLLSPAVGGLLMSASTVIVAINARLLKAE